MSFTEDELQSFNTILEQKLLAHRREMERAFDQRINEFRRDIEQWIVSSQQDTLRNVALKITEYQNRLDALLSQKLNTQQTHITQAFSQDADQRHQQLEATIDRMLAAQLLGIEQLLSQHVSLQTEDMSTQADGNPPHLEAIEVQTELPWEDLMDVIGKALDERLSALNESTQRALKNLEQYLSVRLHGLRDEFTRGQLSPQSYNGNMATTQEMLHGIEHLERIIESMQVAMTANNALLSNRLFHHQQLPLERAHPVNHDHIQLNKATHSSLPSAKEQVDSGVETGVSNKQAGAEEPEGE